MMDNCRFKETLVGMVQDGNILPHNKYGSFGFSINFFFDQASMPKYARIPLDVVFW